jgi:hypothetical protein
VKLRSSAMKTKARSRSGSSDDGRVMLISMADF